MEILKIKKRPRSGIYHKVDDLEFNNFYLIEVRINGHRQRYTFATWTNDFKSGTVIVVCGVNKIIFLCGEGYRTAPRCHSERREKLIMDEKNKLYYSSEGYQFVYDDTANGWDDNPKESKANWMLLGTGDKFKITKIWKRILPDEEMINQQFNTSKKSIEDLNLSMRSHNCLKQFGIRTIQELANMNKSEIEKIKNLGRKSLREITKQLQKHIIDFVDFKEI